MEIIERSLFESFFGKPKTKKFWKPKFEGFEVYADYVNKSKVFLIDRIILFKYPYLNREELMSMKKHQLIINYLM